MLRLLKKIIHKSASIVGYSIVLNSAYKIMANFDPVIDRDTAFKKIYDRCRAYTMTNKEKIYALYKSVQYIVKAKIPGDFVECGVWRGGSVMLIAYTLLELEVTDRKIYLYDTFEGMPRPTADDFRVGHEHIKGLDEWQKRADWCYASLTEVKDNLKGTGYPEERIVFVKGKIEETIPNQAPPQIALLRLDTDFYESTRHELIHFFPRLAKNGVLIVDDYGCWAGSKKAVDEYFSHSPILLHRIDETGIIGTRAQ